MLWTSNWSHTTKPPRSAVRSWLFRRLGRRSRSGAGRLVRRVTRPGGLPRASCLFLGREVLLPMARCLVDGPMSALRSWGCRYSGAIMVTPLRIHMGDHIGDQVGDPVRAPPPPIGEEPAHGGCRGSAGIPDSLAHKPVTHRGGLVVSGHSVCPGRLCRLGMARSMHRLRGLIPLIPLASALFAEDLLRADGRGRG